MLEEKKVITVGIIKKILSKKVQQTITETTQNISSPQYFINNPPINQDKNKFDINSFLNVTKNYTTTQIQNQNITYQHMVQAQA